MCNYAIQIVLIQNIQFVWPETIPSGYDGEVNVDEWWGNIDDYIFEATLFSRATLPSIIEAHKIAPWIPPICRAQKIWNTELWKGCFFS